MIIIGLLQCEFCEQVFLQTGGDLITSERIEELQLNHLGVCKEYGPRMEWRRQQDAGGPKISYGDWKRQQK
jgi:hypothetical protein